MTRPRPKLANVVKQISMMSVSDRERLGASGRGEAEDSRRSLSVPYQERQNNRNQTSTHPHHKPASSLFQRVVQTHIDQQKSDTNALMDHAEHLENLFQVGPEAGLFSMSEDSGLSESDGEEDGYSPNGGYGQSGRDHNDVEQPQSTETSALLQPSRQQAALKRRPKWWKSLKAILQPSEIYASVKDFLVHWVLCFMLPLLVLAYILFYWLGNPNWEFLPTGFSWFLLLFIRLAVTFNLARLSQWVLQLLTVQTSILARMAGPLFALVFMQSQGFPFLLSSWAIWNLILLHGKSHFIRHWFYFTNIELFSIRYNLGNGFLASEMYSRMLFALLLFGMAASIKRTFVALFLSRRMLQNYRPQLELVMSQVKIAMELAELAEETEREGFEDLLQNAKQAAQHRTKAFTEAVPTFGGGTTAARDVGGGGTSSRGSNNDDIIADVGEITASQSKDSGDDDDAEEEEVLAEMEESDRSEHSKGQWSALKQRAMNDRYTMKFSKEGDEDASVASSPVTRGRGPDGGGIASNKRAGFGRKSSRGIDAVYPFLERWQEPEDKGSSKNVASLHDILQFKKAMSFLNGDLKLSRSFGETKNRRDLVKNSVKLYRRLLRFTPDQSVLSFDVIGALAYDGDGDLDEEKAIILLRIFLPDNDDKVPMIAFVQSIDHIYKRMRFLRASLSNASKIDTVLENIFNVLFYGFLAVTSLSLLGYNPWPLLLSFSTILVSFAFAFGTSVARMLEGILLIAVRRPFDIGDRICICAAEMVANPTWTDTWLVEDISLTTTTVRYAATDEFATLNNASLANSRIVNLGRSPKASISLRIRLAIPQTSQEVLDDFRKRIESYLEDRPRVWVSPLIHYRIEQVDVDNCFIVWMFRAQHAKSWQELGPIMVHKGELERYANETASEMGIAFITPFSKLTVGLGLAKTEGTPVTENGEHMKEFIKSLKAD